MVMTAASTFLLALVGFCALSIVHYTEQNTTFGKMIYFYPQVKEWDSSTQVRW
jgi:hypothetical protein